MGDYNLANQSGAAFRAELNGILNDIATQNAGTSAPSPTFANMVWVDTNASPPLLKIRNSADSAWITIGELDTSFKLSGTTTFTRQILDDIDAAAVRATLELLAGATMAIASQAQAEAGTNNATVITPLRAAQAITEQASKLGVGQTWQSVTRSINTIYQNTTGKPIMVFVQGDNSLRGEVSTDQATWFRVWFNTDSNDHGGCFIVPDTHYYRFVGGTFGNANELR